MKNSGEFKKLRVLFDIDGTLVGEGDPDHLSKDLDNILTNKHKRFLSIEEYGDYQLHYGVEALFRYLDAKKEDIDYGFFSAGTENRNRLLISALLTKTFGEGDYSAMINQHVFSRNSCERVTFQKDVRLRKIALPDSTGYETIIIEDSEELSRTILIDNLPTSAFKNKDNDQSKNLMTVPTFYGSEFEFFVMLNNSAKSASKKSSCKSKQTNIENMRHTVKNLYASFNNIFYIAGMIDSLIKKARDRKIAYLESLQQVQNSIPSDMKDLANSQTYKNLVHRGIHVLKPYAKNSDGEFELKEIVDEEFLFADTEKLTLSKQVYTSELDEISLTSLFNEESHDSFNLPPSTSSSCSFKFFKAQVGHAVLADCVKQERIDSNLQSF